MKKRYLYILLSILTLGAIVLLGMNYQNKRINEMEQEYQEAQDDIVEEVFGEPKKIYVNKSNDTIRVKNKYNDTHDIEIEWARGGSNNLFDYQRTSFIENDEPFISERGKRVQYHAASTDFFGPHRITALNNPDGDNLQESIDFTGGNHAYDGNTDGSQTARTENLKLLVDGEEVKRFSGYADNITIEWENYIQASNTKKEDGTGREALKENYTLSFDGERYTVTNTIEFLEDVYWDTYYGLQFSHRDSWNDTITYNDSANTTYSATEDSRSDNLLVDKIVLQEGDHILEFGIDNEVGLGNREYVNNRDYGAFNVSDTSKSYFWLVDGVNMSVGDTASFEGYYQFFYEED